VIERLQKECEADGKAKQFEQLKSFLMAGKSETAHSETARTLGMEEGTVRVASTGCGSVTGSCSATRLPRRSPTRRRWTRRCARYSVRSIRDKVKFAKRAISGNPIV
jgi:hypothetical protein